MSAQTPRARASLGDVPPYVARSHNVRFAPIRYQLAANENPFPPLDSVVDAVARAALTLNRYPDIANHELRECIANDLGVKPSQVVPSTGSVAALFHLVTAYCEPGDEVVYAWRSFEAYPIAATVAGAQAVPIAVAGDGVHDLDAMVAAITDRTKLVLLCSPNNPTGPALTHSDVVEFIARVPSHVVVALDEAYHEFVRMADPLRAIDLLAVQSNVVVMRTMSKAGGLAGLRIGYIVSNDELAAAVHACTLPFGISSVAQAAAVATIAAKAELDVRVDAIVEERDRVAATLRTQGFSVPDPQGNFVWLELGAGTTDFVDAALQKGISLRAFADEGVRITIGETEANDAVLQVAASWRMSAAN